MKNKGKRGFTLVELVVVIAVIAVLASVMIPTFSNVLQKAKDTALITNGTARYREMVVETGENTDCFYVEDGRYLLLQSGGKGTVLGKYGQNGFSEDKQGEYALKDEHTITFNGREIYSIDYILSVYANSDGADGDGDADAGVDGDGDQSGEPDEPIMLSCAAYIGNKMTEISAEDEAGLSSRISELVAAEISSGAIGRAENTWEYVWYSDAQLTIPHSGSYDGNTLYLGIQTKAEYFSITNGRLSYKGELATATRIVIPSEVNGATVTSISDFSEFSSDGFLMIALKEIRINAAVAVPAGFLDGCNTLESVYLCNEVTQVGNQAFRGCINLSTFVANELISVGLQAVPDNSKLSIYLNSTELPSGLSVNKATVYTRDGWGYVGSLPIPL